VGKPLSVRERRRFDATLSQTVGAFEFSLNDWFFKKRRLCSHLYDFRRVSIGV